MPAAVVSATESAVECIRKQIVVIYCYTYTTKHRHYYLCLQSLLGGLEASPNFFGFVYSILLFADGLFRQLAPLPRLRCPAFFSEPQASSSHCFALISEYSCSIESNTLGHMRVNQVYTSNYAIMLAFLLLRFKIKIISLLGLRMGGRLLFTWLNIVFGPLWEVADTAPSCSLILFAH